MDKAIQREVERKARLQAHVARVVADAPPMTDEQRATIARLLIAGKRDAVVSKPRSVRIER